MFAQPEYKIIDELKFGDPDIPGTWLRLEESESGKRVIRHWSSMSKQWNVMYRYNVQENWEMWKRHETETSLPAKERTNKRSVCKAADASRTSRVPRKKSKRKPISE